MHFRKIGGAVSKAEMELIKLCCKYLASLVLHIFWVFPVRSNRIFVMNDLSHTYGCSPKYICEYLLTHEPGRYEIIYPLAIPDSAVPKNIITVRPGTTRYLHYALTSRVIVTNCGGISYLPIRSSQMVLNTWHGGGAYKKNGLAAYHGFFYQLEMRLNAKKTDYLMASTQIAGDEYPEALLIEKNKILKSGIPRVDLFFTDYSHIREKVYRSYGIKKEKRVVMYCPTFRSGENALVEFYRAKRQEMVVPDVLAAMSRRFGGEWILAVRMHPRLGAKTETNSDEMVDFSGYPDAQELLCAADAVISDYSSLIWDYSFTGNPCFLYADDIRKYQESPGFYTPIEKWPYPIAEDFQSLIGNILNFDEKMYQQAVKKHYQDVGSYETGTATETACRLISDFCLPGGHCHNCAEGAA